MSDDPILRRTLAANGAFSLSSGCALLIAPTSVASWTGLPAGPSLPVVGALLLGWAALTLNLANGRRISTAHALLVSGGDLLWVIGTVAGLALFGDHLTPLGVGLVAGVGVVVGVFAGLQQLGLRRLGRGGRPPSLEASA